MRVISEDSTTHIHIATLSSSQLRPEDKTARIAILNNVTQAPKTSTWCTGATADTRFLVLILATKRSTCASALYRHCIVYITSHIALKNGYEWSIYNQYRDGLLNIFGCLLFI